MTTASRGFGAWGAGATTLAIGGVDAGLGWAHVTGGLRLDLALGLHAVIALGAFLVLPRLWADRASAAATALAVLTLGPVGALLAVATIATTAVLGWRLASGRRAWLEQLSLEAPRDLEHALHADIESGRAYRPAAGELPSFPNISARGDRGEQLAMLATISRRFHPDHRPLIEAALKSRDAAVRVSAAAIYAALRDRTKRAVADMKRADPGAGDVDIAFKAARYARSGVLDRAEAAEARAVALALLDAAQPGFAAGGEAEADICRLLADEGRHAEICDRLWPVADEIPLELRQVLAHALMRAGRHRKLVELHARPALAGVA